MRAELRGCMRISLGALSVEPDWLPLAAQNRLKSSARSHHITFSLSADFYAGVNVEDKASGFTVTNKPPANDIPSRVTEPKLPAGIGRVKRVVTASWDCCPDNNETNVEIK